MDPDPDPTPPLGGSPVVRPPAVVARPAPDPFPGGGATDRAGDGAGPAGHRWRRLTRTRRGAAGLAIVAAALLLWPFAGWFWIPWLAGFAVLVLVAVLRLDRLLRGWTWHVGGVAVVVGLMLRTGPWDWALAASIGVLLAGLVQLPWWRLAAVGAVLCLVAGVGWGVDRHRAAQEAAAQQAQQARESFSLLGERTPQRVLPALLESIGQADVGGACTLLAPEARAEFARAAGAPDCAAAVAHFHAALPRVPPLRDLDAPVLVTPGGTSVDGCRTIWASTGLGGPSLGVIDVLQTPPPGQTYFVSGFRPCGTTGTA